MSERAVAIGAAVIYVDPRGKRREAIVTAVWGKPEEHPAINVVFVSADDAKHDNCGRQVERATSVVHQTAQPAPGNYWIIE